VTEAVPGFEVGTKTFAHKLSWSVSSHGLTVGEKLTLHAQSADLNDVSGPNQGQSSPMMFRIVSPEELLAELSRREQEYRQDFERIIRMQEDLYADLLTLSRETDLEPGERRQRFRRLSRRQRDQSGRINTLNLQFEQVLSELRINQLADVTVEERLDGGVIGPLSRLVRVEIAVASETLTALAQNDQNPDIQTARDAQDQVLEQMRAILNRMLKWERFQEAVMLLREVMKMQSSVNQETEKAIEADIMGTTRPASDVPQP
jgi:sugar-specific transcriptional regulator TrmB